MDQDLLRVVIPEACKLILGILGKGESPMLGNSSFLSGVKTVQK